MSFKPTTNTYNIKHPLSYFSEMDEKFKIIKSEFENNICERIDQFHYKSNTGSWDPEDDLNFQIRNSHRRIDNIDTFNTYLWREIFNHDKYTSNTLITIPIIFWTSLKREIDIITNMMQNESQKYQEYRKIAFSLPDETPGKVDLIKSMNEFYSVKNGPIKPNININLAISNLTSYSKKTMHVIDTIVSDSGMSQKTIPDVIPIIISYL